MSAAVVPIRALRGYVRISIHPSKATKTVNSTIAHAPYPARVGSLNWTVAVTGNH